MSLHRWATEYSDSTPTVLDPAPANEAAFTLEERSVYSTGINLTEVGQRERYVLSLFVHYFSMLLRLLIDIP
jgi:hypothetical protein